MITLDHLPEDILSTVIQYIPNQQDRVQLAHACQRLYTILVPYLWRNVVLADLAILGFLDLLHNINQSNKSVIVRTHDAIDFKSKTKRNAERLNSLFEITSKPLENNSKHQHLYWDMNVPPSLLSDIGRQLLNPYLLQSIYQLDILVNFDYGPVDSSISSKPTAELGEQKHASSIPKFSFLCQNVLRPSNFPHLESVILRYKMSHHNNHETANSEMKDALQQMDLVCGEFGQQITVCLINWSLPCLLDTLDECPHISSGIRKLTIPKLGKFLPVTKLKHKLNKLTDLSVGVYSATGMSDTLNIDTDNFRPFQHFVSQLKSLKTFDLFGIAVNCDAASLIPPSITDLDFPESGLFNSRYSGARLSLSLSLQNLKSLCIRFGYFSCDLPYSTSEIPFTNLESLKILHTCRKIDYSPLKLYDFYTAIFSKNPKIERLCLDLVYTMPIKAINTALCPSLRHLSLLNPTLDYSYPNSLDQLMGTLQGAKTLETLKLHVLGNSLGLPALVDFVCNSHMLEKVIIIQERTTSPGATIYNSLDNKTGNSSSSTTANYLEDFYRHDREASPEYLGSSSDDNNQEFISDLLLVEENLQTLNGLGFDESVINTRVSYDDLNIRLGFRRDYPVLVEPYFGQIRQNDDLLESGFHNVQPNVIELKKNLESGMLESIPQWQKYFKVIDIFTDKASMSEIKYLNSHPTEYTEVQCILPEIKKCHVRNQHS